MLVASVCKKKMWWGISSFDYLYLSHVLYFGKILFYLSLLLMTKYCVMRKCENIHSGYFYVSDIIFVMKKGISILKFPERFLDISSRDLTSLLPFSQY